MAALGPGWIAKWKGKGPAAKRVRVDRAEADQPAPTVAGNVLKKTTKKARTS
jgi:hypothetical protein